MNRTSYPSFPAPTRPLVGRGEVLGLLWGAVVGSPASLVTLCGAPGIGKTRLAQEVALRWVRERRGDVAWAELGGAAGDELAERVVPALGLSLDPDDDPEVTIGRALHAREGLLLVLDEAEGVVVQVARALVEWRRRAPAVHVLVTSRERLRLGSEHVVELGPLDVAGEGVDLFLARAGFDVDDAMRERIRQLVEGVDGIPLAVELAAASAETLGLEPLLARLGEHLDLLGPAPREAQARHATLRTAIGASWSQLGDEERQAFARLSLFAGGFTLDEAELVLGDGAAQRIAGLHEKSLLQVRREDALPRYSLLASLQQFASEQLGDARELELRRLGRALAPLALAKRAEAEAGDGDATRWLERMQETLARSLEALLTSPNEEDRAQAVELARAASLGLHRSPRRALAVLERVEDAGAKTGGAGFWVAVGRARLGAANVAGAEEALGRALERAARGETTREEHLIALAEKITLEQTRGCLDEAEAVVERGEALLIGGSDRFSRALFRRSEGLLHHGRGQLDMALRAYEQALTDAETLGHGALVGSLQTYIGAVRLQQGRLEEAEESFDAARSEATQSQDLRAEALVVGNLAILAQEVGDRDTARRRYLDAIAAAAETGARLVEGHLTGYLGTLEHEEGRLTEAVERYRQALTVLVDVGDRRLEALFRACAGAAEAARGRVSAAEEQLARAEERLSDIGDEGLELALRLLRCHLELAHAAAGESTRKRVRGEIAQAQTSDALGGSDDARLALRLLTHALQDEALVVRRGGAEIQPPGREAIALDRRESLRRIVVGLAELRRDRPGETLDMDGLLALGWPGEKVSAAAARNRVKVTLTTLRNLGLRDVLQRHGDGYRFDPDVPLVNE